MNPQWVNWIIESPLIIGVLLKMTAFLILAWIAHFALRRANPRWRVLLWRGVAVGLIAIPVLAATLPPWKVPVVPSRPPPATHLATQSKTVVPLPLPAPASSTLTIPIHEPTLSREPEPLRVMAPAAIAEEPTLSFWAWVKQHWTWIAACVWVLFALALAFRFCLAWRRVRRMVKGTIPAPSTLQEVCAKVASALGIVQPVEIRLSDKISSPFLTGLRHPVLILPRRMAEPAYSRELRAILAHELSHVRSNDLLWSYVLRWLTMALWFHPLLWRVRAAHASACEEVSDAITAAFLGDAKAYSQTLARVALEMAYRPPAIGGIPMARVSDISRRLRALRRQVFSSPLSRTSLVVSLVGGLMAIGLLSGLRFAYSQRDEAREKAKSGELKTTQALSPSPTVTESDAPKTQVGERGQIRGAVVNADTGEPIAGAYVAIDHSGDAGGSNLGRFREQGIYVTTEADERGRFLLDGVAFRDDHPFTVTHPGFVRHQETIALRMEEPEIDVRVRVRPAATLVAKIVNADGKLLEENAILRLEAEDGRPFLPLRADWPDLPYRTESTTTGMFSFGELDTGTFSIEAMRIGNMETTYHAKVSNIAVKAGETKKVLLMPADHGSTIKIKIEKDPHASLGERKGAAAMLVSPNPGLLAWANRNFYHPEDERLGRVWKSALIMASLMPVEDADTLRKLEARSRLESPSKEGNVSFFLGSQGITYTLSNFPEGEYAVFTYAVGMYQDWKSPAVYMRGAKAVVSLGKERTIEIPYVEPIGPSPTNARTLYTVVNLEARAYTAQEICGLLLKETGAKEGEIVPDSSIEREKVMLPAAKLQIWDLLETIYLKKGWRLEADYQAKKVFLRPGPAGETSRGPGSELLVTPLVGIGEVRFGMSEEEVINILGEPDKRQPRSLIYRPLGFSVTVHPTVGTITFGCFTKKAIPWWDAFYTKDFRGRTKEGIGMGSSEKQITKAFGKPDERDEQGRQVVLTYQTLGLWFVLLSDRVIQFSMMIPSQPVDTSNREPIYEEKANGEELIKEAVRAAQAQDKRILVVFGYNECPWCWTLHDFFKENEKVRKALDENYVVVRIDVRRNKDLAKRLKEPGRYPGLVFLDKDGNWVASEATGPLVAVQWSKETGEVTGTGYEEDRVLSVLNKRAE
jgi:beta-lactamase regulating signal transducer with metallopeptidase domain